MRVGLLEMKERLFVENIRRVCNLYKRKKIDFLTKTCNESWREVSAHGNHKLFDLLQRSFLVRPENFQEVISRLSHQVTAPTHPSEPLSWPVQPTKWPIVLCHGKGNSLNK